MIVVQDVATNALPVTFEERIVREAKRFDLRPLLDVLQEHGYERSSVTFEASAEDAASPGVIESVRFPAHLPGTVIITVNLGLLARGNLLPSYFFQVIQGSERSAAFYDFLRFFDNRLVHNYLLAIYPEDEGGAFGDYEQLLSSYLRLMGPGSLSSLWWLFQRYFPDFPVRVMRRPFTSDTAAHAMMMGASKLDGTAVLGKVYATESAGFVVELTVEFETDLRGRPWADVVLERFRSRLLPILEPYRIPFVLRLHVLSHTGYARLEDPAQPTKGRLGYDRLRQKKPSPLTMVLYPEPGHQHVGHED